MMDLEPVVRRIMYTYISILIVVSVTMGIAIGGLTMYFLQ